MAKGRRWVLQRPFDGMPKQSDFKLVEEDLPDLKDGEFRFKTLFLSVDPYMRAYVNRSPIVS